MATETVLVTLTSEYVAMSADDNDVTIWLKRGQRCRLHIGESAPATGETAYILVEGPSTNTDGVMCPFRFEALTVSGGDVYARYDDVAITILVVRVESS